MRTRETVLRPAAVGLALVMPLGGLAGCGSGVGAAKKSWIAVPEHFYLRPPGDTSGPTNKVPFHVQAEDVKARSRVGTQDHRLTVDVTGSEQAVRLKISDIRKKNPRCTGTDTRVVCKVSGAYNSWSDIDRVYPYAAPGSKPGDSGTVRFSFTTEKGKKLSARTRVVVGEPVVKVRTTKVFKDVGPGSVLSTPVVVRNTGEVPVRGVGLQLSVGTGLRFKDQYGNCRYPEPQKGSLAMCEFPGVRIPPGAGGRPAPGPGTGRRQDGDVLLVPPAGVGPGHGPRQIQRGARGRRPRRRAPADDRDRQRLRPEGDVRRRRGVE
ncbi:hypothetical protein ACRJ4W_29760 [Streptomyces sp. GLT-R25]